jgi:hypothetical protein
MALPLSAAGTSPGPQAFAQSIPGARARGVLPTGGGAALPDPSDNVILLLDHQTSLFQTVKDIGVAELRANTTILRQGV